MIQFILYIEKAKRNERIWKQVLHTSPNGRCHRWTYTEELLKARFVSGCYFGYIWWFCKLFAKVQKVLLTLLDEFVYVLIWSTFVSESVNIAIAVKFRSLIQCLCSNRRVILQAYAYNAVSEILYFGEKLVKFELKSLLTFVFFRFWKWGLNFEAIQLPEISL